MAPKDVRDILFDKWVNLKSTFDSLKAASKQLEPPIF